MVSRSMRIIAFPYHGIAYTSALYSAIEAEGAEVLEADWSGRWLYHNIRKGDVVHIHWPSFMYLTAGTRRAILKSFWKCLLFLAIIRLRKGRIWWTAHNLLPHERCALPSLDLWARHLVVRLATRIFVHGPEAEAVLVGRYPRARGKCVRIPHGNWIGHYLPVLTREEARAKLGLPQDAFVYLCFGQCKPYKNVDGLIRAFRLAAAESDILLIAGGFADQSYLTTITELVDGDPRIRIVARFIADQDVSTYLYASDVMCVPYREILTSGAAMLSLSCGRPVISVSRGAMRDHLSEATGILVQVDDEQALVRALREARERNWSAEEIIRHAQRFSFADAARITLSAAKGS